MRVKRLGKITRLEQRHADVNRLLRVARHCGIVLRMSNDELLTSPQAGAILGKSARTVQRMVENGVLTPAQKLPGPAGHYLFRRSDVEALLAGAA